MSPVTRSCESTMLIDCPTAMSVSYSRLPATVRPSRSVSPPRRGRMKEGEVLSHHGKLCTLLLNVRDIRMIDVRSKPQRAFIAALFQNPSPFFENGSGPLRSADDIARQRVVLPRKRRGGIDNHPRVRVQLALIRRDGHVDAAALGVLDDLYAALRIAAGQDRPNDVLNIRDVHMLIDNNCEPVHLYPA